MRIDEHQRFRDELAERRRERDREREPRTWRRTARDQRARQAFQARQIDLANIALDTAITAFECPLCCGPLFAPGDSNGERVDCPECDARLVTVRTTEGVVAMEVPHAGV